MKVRCFKTERVGTVPFEGLRELSLPIAAAATETIMDALAGATVCCRRGDVARAGLDCLLCPRLVNFKRAPAGLLVRCLFADDDVVHAIMTLVSAGVTVRPTTPPAQAIALGVAQRVSHLLVVDADELIGVVRCADLATAGSVTAVANSSPWVVAPDASLGQVVSLVRRTDATLILVVDGQDVVGLVTPRDLQRFGVPAELLQHHA